MPMLSKPKIGIRSRALKPPTQITVRGLFTGTNVVKWRRVGRGGTLRYVIESRLPGESEWDFVAVIDGGKYNHMDQMPGQARHYRVLTQRGDLLSSASEVATVYPVAEAAVEKRVSSERMEASVRRPNAHRVLCLPRPLSFSQP